MLYDRVIPATGKRIAAQEADDSFSASSPETIALYTPYGVIRTRGIIATEALPANTETPIMIPRKSALVDLEEKNHSHSRTHGLSDTAVPLPVGTLSVPLSKGGVSGAARRAGILARRKASQRSGTMSVSRPGGCKNCTTPSSGSPHWHCSRAPWIIRRQRLRATARLETFLEILTPQRTLA